MAQKRRAIYTRRPVGNLRREKMTFAQVLISANRRAHEQANRRSGKREMKSMRAAIAATDLEDGDIGSIEWTKRLLRWLLAMVLLPVCWVTTWTFLSRFSHATLDQGFWQKPEFWYFATGALLMIGWFWSGLFKQFFLYLYVLGHEMTHAIFVVCFRGKVTDFHVSTEGGYITTDKTNLIIALSPYFVPFWSVVLAVIYAVMRISSDLRPGWDLAFYGAMGLTWTFHMAWTIWMIPRDQPDLRENGTLLSLVVIYMANLLVLVGLLCVAEPSPLLKTREFAMEWLRHAATWSDVVWRWAVQLVTDMKTAGKL